MAGEDVIDQCRVRPAASRTICSVMAVDGTGSAAAIDETGASMTHRQHPRALVVALTVLALIAGCTNGDDGAGEDVDTEETVDTDPTDGEAGTSEDPDGGEEGHVAGLPPVGDVAPADVPSDIDLDALDGLPVLSGLVWTLRMFGPDGPPTQTEAEAALTDAFLAEVPSGQFVGLAGQLQADWRVTGLEDAAAEQVQVEISAEGERLHLWVAVTGEDPPRISGVLFQPPLDDPIGFGSWDEVEAALTSMVAEVRYLVARVEDEACVAIAELDADQRGPLGSAFKLYVLGAVVDAVAEGGLAWDDEMELTQKVVSHPSGVLQAEEPGTLVSVAEAAELMIGISDNTATDLLIDAVGRDAVEQALSDYGHTSPEVNQPLLTTREMFQLAASSEHTAEFLAADEAGRRAVLDDLADEPLPGLDDLSFSPHVPHEPEWYASPTELCDALVALDAATSAEGMGPGRAAFGAEAPLRIDDDWEPIGAKGGSQPGVQAHTGLFRRGDERYAFTITLDHDAEIDVRALIPTLEGMLALAADEHDAG